MVLSFLLPIYFSFLFLILRSKTTNKGSLVQKFILKFNFCLTLVKDYLFKSKGTFCSANWCEYSQLHINRGGPFGRISLLFQNSISLGNYMF